MVAGTAGGTAAVVGLHAVLLWRAVSLPPVIGLCLVGALGWRAVVAVGRRTPDPPGPIVQLPRVRPYSAAFARAGHIAGLLDFVPSEVRHFEYGVRPLLVDLIDDRLRRHHGIDRRERPDLARTTMGEQLWTLVTTTPERSPSSQQLRAWVTAIERL